MGIVLSSNIEALRNAANSFRQDNKAISFNETSHYGAFVDQASSDS